MNFRLQQALRPVSKQIIPVSLDNQRNAWGLFNQMNQAVRRTLYSDARASRRILGDHRAEKFLAQTLEVA